MVTVVVERHHVLCDGPDEESGFFFFIVETVCVPCGYVVRLKKQFSIKNILITEPDFRTPVDEISVGVLENKEIGSE